MCLKLLWPQTCGGRSVDRMFIQIMQGKCTRQDELRALTDEWIRDLSPGATGWLGGTYGFTDDDLFIGVIRFESRDAAMANSERPEQGEFAERMGALMDGPVEFHDSDDVTLLLDGGSDDAGFVQVIRGKVDDPARLKSILADADGLREMRPDIVGASLAVEHGRHVHRDGRVHLRGSGPFRGAGGAAGGDARRPGVRHAGRDVLRPAQPLVRALPDP